MDRRVPHLPQLLVALCALGCGASAEENPRATVILVSIDGFRWDFRDFANTPTLDSLAAAGVTAEQLIPPFPTATFPSHYTMLTGLHPERHGIVSNTMYDPEWDAWFRTRDVSETQNGRWWGGEPIWITLQRQGGIAATFFWPGTDADVGGTRPRHWTSFDISIPHERRVRQVLDWLDYPDAKRPDLITLYFGIVDRIAHDFAIGSPELADTIERVDRSLGILADGIAARGLANRVNLVIVSDHGMAPRSRDRVVFIDDYIDVTRANAIDWGPVWTARPDPADLDAIYNMLASAHPHLAVYRRETLPDRWHFSEHRRIPPIVAVADEGWFIATRSFYERDPAAFEGNMHGYDNALESMGGLFIASGPAFANGRVVPPFQNVHIYELLCHLLGITPSPNQGSLDSVRAAFP